MDQRVGRKKQSGVESTQNPLVILFRMFIQHKFSYEMNAMCCVGDINETIYTFIPMDINKVEMQSYGWSVAVATLDRPVVIQSVSVFFFFCVSKIFAIRIELNERIYTSVHVFTDGNIYVLRTPLICAFHVRCAKLLAEAEAYAMEHYGCGNDL